MKHCDNLPSILKPNKAVNYVMESVCVFGLPIIVGGEQVGIFNIYIHSPSHNLKHHDKWLSLLCNNVYTMVHGASFPLKLAYHCSTCKGQGHPTGLCAFLSMPGWVDGAQNDQGPQDAPNNQEDVDFPNSNNSGKGCGCGSGHGNSHGNFPSNSMFLNYPLLIS
ncbi:hypothetical protein M422DRAFT_263728 [Sphaerobolus stellatus SS14]|uniref:Uncharacterized protein n=1 Tax=Sphaerobolus stellatus (strain SS14) TaxID=990650 RepID=A0A0C9UH94_SPHS4|nr:hypothetical protein M422DRAFT_263728 [Sphaerobolus stellatus SS14]